MMPLMVVNAATDGVVYFFEIVASKYYVYFLVLSRVFCRACLENDMFYFTTINLLSDMHVSF